MTLLVDQREIEQIVGARRRPSTHIGRLVTELDRIFILHSAACLREYPDLRDCPYSRALDLSCGEPWRIPTLWGSSRDVPVALAIYRGLLTPGKPLNDFQETT